MIEELKKAFNESKKALKDKDKLNAESAKIEAELPEYDSAERIIKILEDTTEERDRDQKSLEKEEKNKEKKAIFLHWFVTNSNTFCKQNDSLQI